MSSNSEAYISDSPQPINVESLSGKARTVVEIVLGMRVSPCGEHKITISKQNIYGYGSEEGIFDEEGRKWYFTIRCPKCGCDFEYDQWNKLL